MVTQVQALLRIDERIADVLNLLNVPSAQEMRQMQAKLDELAQKLDKRESNVPSQGSNGPEKSLGAADPVEPSA